MLIHLIKQNFIKLSVFELDIFNTNISKKLLSNYVNYYDHT